MFIKLFSVALIIALATAFTLSNPYCDDTNIGAKEVSYSTSVTYPADAGFVKIG